jgi:hypothetical protein
MVASPASVVDHQDMGRQAVLAICSLILVACQTGSQVPQQPGSFPMGTTITELPGRLLSLPKIATGSPCPTSAVSQPTPQYGPSLGAGPAYMLVPHGLAAGRVSVSHLLIAPTYSGPLRLRGGRLDGPGEMLFESTGQNLSSDQGKMVTLATERRLLYSEVVVGGSTSPNEWRFNSGGSYESAIGCYGWQIDGSNFSEQIFDSSAPPN